MATIHIAYAHPIGEDSGVVWMAAGVSPEAAIARLTEKVREGWYATDAEIDADEDPEEADAVRADRASLDLHDTTEWVLVVEQDTIDL